MPLPRPPEQQQRKQAINNNNGNIADIVIILRIDTVKFDLFCRKCTFGFLGVPKLTNSRYDYNKAAKTPQQQTLHKQQN